MVAMFIDFHEEIPVTPSCRQFELVNSVSQRRQGNLPFLRKGLT